MNYLYKITNKKSKRTYIGQTQNPTQRIEQHKKSGHNISLQTDLILNGENNFDFEIIKESKSGFDISLQEIKEIMTQNNIYNKASGGILTHIHDVLICDFCHDSIKLNFKETKNQIFLLFYGEAISPTCHKCIFNAPTPLTFELATLTNVLYLICSQELSNINLLKFTCPNQKINQLITWFFFNKQTIKESNFFESNLLETTEYKW